MKNKKLFLTLISIFSIALCLYGCEVPEKADSSETVEKRNAMYQGNEEVTVAGETATTVPTTTTTKVTTTPSVTTSIKSVESPTITTETTINNIDYGSSKFPNWSCQIMCSRFTPKKYI